MTDYDYDEPEAAAIDLLENRDTDEVYYGLVRAVMVEEDRIIFYDTDSGNSVAQARWSDNAEEKEKFEDVVRILDKSDEEIRNEL